MRMVLWLFLIGVTFGCNKHLNDITDWEWKYTGGLNIGEVLRFDDTNSYKIDCDGKIYKNGNEYVASVLSIYNFELEVVNTKGEIGYYFFIDTVQNFQNIDSACHLFSQPLFLTF